MRSSIILLPAPGRTGLTPRGFLFGDTMAISAKVVADTISPISSVRLTTLEVRFPRFLLAQLNTHRALSRNGSSSRALSVGRRIDEVLNDPYLPSGYGKKARSMWADEELPAQARIECEAIIIEMLDYCAAKVAELNELGLHKHVANRYLEPWAWQRCLVTATQWDNFFSQRCHHDAQPAFQELACAMRDARAEHTPRVARWHVPFLYEEEQAQLSELERTYGSIGRLSDIEALMGQKPYREGADEEVLAEIVMRSAGRCARVSYLTHEGERDPDADVALCRRLIDEGHMSPLEHQAMATNLTMKLGNFHGGWRQFRKHIPGEAVFGSVPTKA